jgi:hypothetical protein
MVGVAYTEALGVIGVIKVIAYEALGIAWIGGYANWVRRRETYRVVPGSQASGWRR